MAILTQPVTGSVERTLPFAARNVAVYWKGHPDARVSIAFSRDGVHFGRAVDVGRDEIGAMRNNGVTYGSMLSTVDARVLRVRSSQRMPSLTVLGLRARVRAIVDQLSPTDAPITKAPMPPVVSRAEWGADESLRFRRDGTEKWKPQFAPIQKLIVHHTASPNKDPHPAATVRSIYYYHAITQDWGDIGYNFLIDESGRIYKGRNSHGAGTTNDSLTGQDAQGQGVAGAHALAHNKGSVGVALLGTLTGQDATPAAKQSLERLLAWEADAHNIDPHGSSPYTSSTGAQSTFPNIAGHRDTGRQTACPGDAFYRSLPQVRNGVASRMG